jgi:DNA-directed RNA polymerase specialized sigma24 family protein
VPMSVPLNRSATFATTQWTVVLEAKDIASPQAHAAIGELCRVYWFPLYAYAISRGHSMEDAQDLTQEFFYRLLNKNYLGIADRRKGRFRWFLLKAFKAFLANQSDRERAAKRGGGKPAVSLDAVLAERNTQLEPRCEAAQDREFDRDWALAVLEQTQQHLRAEYVSVGKGERYKLLEQHLPGKKAMATYADAAAALGISEGAIKVEMHRMKRRFGELLRAEIAQTVASEKEVDEEIRYLIAAIS